MSEREFESRIDTISKIVSRQYSKKRNLDAQGVPLIFKVLLSLAFVLSVAFLAMGYFVPDQGLIYRIATYTMFGISFLIVFTTSIYNFVRNVDRVSSFDDMVKMRLDQHFNKINKQLMDKELAFYAMHGHYWIELRILAKKARYEIPAGDSSEEEEKTAERIGMKFSN